MSQQTASSSGDAVCLLMEGALLEMDEPIERHARVRVDLATEGYDILIGPGLLGEVGALCRPRPGRRACVVTAEPLADALAPQLLDGLREAGWQFDLLLVPDGEAFKSPAQAVDLCRAMSRSGLDRGGLVFALGGGVIGDLAGFAAAIYLRGIDFVGIPTTLLAQVDASVGGKVAVDLPEGKNLLGAFHQPQAVFIDTLTLRSLPLRQMQSGMAEVIKHAVIADADLFAYLESEIDSVYGQDPGILRHILQRNCQIKADVVAQDPKESGLRAVLNAGHTIGHAVEASSEWRISHGEGVALGMMAETRLAVRLGRCAEDDCGRLMALLERAGLGGGIEHAELAAARVALARDKKIRDGLLRLPLITGIGSVEVFDDISLEMVDEALSEMLRQES